MNLFVRILWIPFRRKHVEERAIPYIAKVVAGCIKEYGLPDFFPNDDILDELLSIAIDRAAKCESDGLARYGNLMDEVELVSRAFISAMHGKEISIPAVELIAKKIQRDGQSATSADER